MLANAILLIRPANFGFNRETATSNAFQNNLAISNEELAAKVTEEFDRFVKDLRAKDVEVVVVDDTASPVKPDAIFPNNWISFHPDGQVILYPMHAANRRLERRIDIIEKLREGYFISKVDDLSGHELKNKFLEGTGSIVFDHRNKIAYACISPRTDKLLFEQLCAGLGYRTISFDATDSNGQQIYHTNVMMCIGDGFSVICLDSIADKNEKANVKGSLENSGLEVIDISFMQMNSFAGNMLQIQNRAGKKLLVMSELAFNSLQPDQKQRLTKYTELLPISISTIETIGGGSARCMMAELFLPHKDSN